MVGQEDCRKRREASWQRADGSERKTLSAMRRALGVSGDRQQAAGSKQRTRNQENSW